MEIDSLAIWAKWSVMQPQRLKFDWTTDQGIWGRADKEIFQRVRNLWIICSWLSRFTATVSGTNSFGYIFNRGLGLLCVAVKRMNFATSQLASFLADQHKSKEETGDFELSCQGKVVRAHSFILMRKVSILFIQVHPTFSGQNSSRRQWTRL